MDRLRTVASASRVERAFESLFRSYYSAIVTSAYNRLGDRPSAEDAAEEVFTTAWRRRADEESALTVEWLYSALRNVVGNEYRRRQRAERRFRRLTDESHSATAWNVDTDAIDVRRAVSMLRPEDRELIWMVHWEELRPEEMAKILGCSYAAIKARVHRARQRLRAILNTHFTEIHQEEITNERG